jgi:hypothetical protein
MSFIIYDNNIDVVKLCLFPLLLIYVLKVIAAVIKMLLSLEMMGDVYVSSIIGLHLVVITSFIRRSAIAFQLKEIAVFLGNINYYDSGLLI